MKRILTSALLICAFACVAFAGNGIKYVSGDKKLFKTAQGKALLEICWDGATYDSRRPLIEEWPDLKEYKAKARSGFIQDFDKKCKSVKVTEEAAEANYKITIRITNVDRYIKVMGLIPGPSTKVWGTLVVSDSKTGEQLLNINLDSVEGGASPSPFESMSDTFELIGEKLAGYK